VRNQNLKIGIVGATGVVGREILQVLSERALNIEKLHLWASEKSAGEAIQFKEADYKVELLTESSFDGLGLDFVFFAGGGGVSAEYAPIAADSGAVVIDNSSHFRMDAEVPLVVPEVNPQDVDLARAHGIIANPNCSTIQMVVALKPLHDAFGLKRVIVSTYQSVSGAGADAMEELREQVQQMFQGKEIESRNFSTQMAFNCIPHIDVFMENGFTKEEMKMINETRKIMALSDLKITATAVRVPTFVSHSESLNLEFEKDIDPESARKVLTGAPSISVCDDPKNDFYPTPFMVSGNDLVFVGRIRQDDSVPRGLSLWVVADNLRKGAATNAVQIAEICMDRKLSRAAA
jgi:aspartate-semialdehyde dehydrogenase